MAKLANSTNLDLASTRSPLGKIPPIENGAVRRPKKIQFEESLVAAVDRLDVPNHVLNTSDSPLLCVVNDISSYRRKNRNSTTEFRFLIRFIKNMRDYFRTFRIDQKFSIVFISLLKKWGLFSIATCVIKSSNMLRTIYFSYFYLSFGLWPFSDGITITGKQRNITEKKARNNIWNFHVQSIIVYLFCKNFKYFKSPIIKKDRAE